MRTPLNATSSTRYSDRRTLVYIGMYSAVLYTVLLTAPVIAEKLAVEYSLAPEEIGLLFSLELGTFSLATIPAFLWLSRVNLHTASYVFTAIFILANFISGIVDSYVMLVVWRVITSVAAGSITIITLSLAGKTSNPSRSYGFWLVTQLSMGALVLAIFPSLYADSDVSAIYWTLAGLGVLCFGIIHLIDPNSMRKSATVVRTAQPSQQFFDWRVLVGLASVLLFYVSLTGTWSYMGQISVDAGTDLNTTSLILSVASLAGVASSVVATILGESPRAKLYIIAGYLAMVLSTATLFGAPAAIRFAIAAIIFKFAWTFLLPYLLSAVAALRPNGQIMNIVNLMIGSGFAIGPMLGGWLIGATGGFTAMLTVSALGLCLSAVCAVAISRSKSKAEPSVGVPPSKEPALRS